MERAFATNPDRHPTTLERGHEVLVRIVGDVDRVLEVHELVRLINLLNLLNSYVAL